MDVPLLSGPAIPLLGDAMRYTISPISLLSIEPGLPTTLRVFARGGLRKDLAAPYRKSYFRTAIDSAGAFPERGDCTLAELL